MKYMDKTFRGKHIFKVSTIFDKGSSNILGPGHVYAVEIFNEVWLDNFSSCSPGIIRLKCLLFLWMDWFLLVILMAIMVYSKHIS